MTKRTLALSCGALILGTSSTATAQYTRFEVFSVTQSANDLTPDGRYVVGQHNNGRGYIRDNWTGVLTQLPAPGLTATAVSDDGTVIAGDIPDPEGIGSEVAARWTQATGWVSLGALPDALGCPSRSNAYEISADGTVIVGLSWDGCSGRGFRWDLGLEEGMQELEPSVNGSCRASVVSGDGWLAGGFCQGSFSRTPVTWTGDLALELLDPPDGDAQGEIFGITDDGAFTLGSFNFDAFIRDEATGIKTFFQTLIGAWHNIPMDIADNGTIVGFDIQQTSRIAWIKPNGGNPVNFKTYLTDLGVEGLPSSLEVIQAISTDGRVMIGHNAFYHGWVVNLCVPDLDGSGAVDFGDLLEVLSFWGETGVEADLDRSGDVGFDDLLEVLSLWGPCPASE